MYRKISLAFLILICYGCNHIRTTRYNLDFEYTTDANLPTQWGIPDKSYHGYASELDSKQKKSGRYSLRMSQIDPEKSGWAIFYQSLPASIIQGKTVELKGWIKTNQLTDGFADLYLEEYEHINYNNFPIDTLNRGVRNSSDWTQIVIKKQFDDHASYIEFGGIMKGRGEAWFDNLEISIDGIPLRDTIQPSPKIRLTRKDKQELRKYLLPIRTVAPDATDTNDLNVLKELIGESSVVALGENTHGSSEIFRLKDRFIRYMVEELGFDVFSIEADMPKAYPLNGLIQDGEGDPVPLICRMGMWIWCTDEMLSLVNWMKKYNDRKPKSEISFTGFDMQSVEGSVENLKTAFKDDNLSSQLIGRIEDALTKVLSYSSIGNPQIDAEIASAIERELSKIDERMNKLPDDKERKEWLRQNVTLIRQFLGQGPLAWRDRCMADNILWIKRQEPSSRIMIWAHNGHIERCSGKMGGYLNDALDSDYTNFGFTFYDGVYTALNRDGKSYVQKATTATTAYPGTVEYILEQLDEPIFILDLKKMREEGAPALTWIDDLSFRHVGAIKVDNEFPDKKITERFDYLVFMRETSPSHLFWMRTTGARSGFSEK